MAFYMRDLLICGFGVWRVPGTNPPEILRDGYVQNARWVSSWVSQQSHQVSSFQSLSRPTLCDPMGSSMSGFPVHHQLPEPTVGKVMSLLFNMLSRLAIAFLPRSKHLLISWLQSPSAVILEPRKIKSLTVSYCFPIYLPWSDGTECHDISFLNIEF